ncbi:hypothetical protein AX14_010214 [Amanita brunnescens Koide BX004]|nr:hypothetical protein AX14_010214 [Amanita brunnescens Koide BX004]
MHMKNCEDCVQFALHVASQTRGGTSEILIEKQKRHWRKILEREFRKAREEGRKLADKEKDDEIERLNNEADELKDKLGWYRSQLDALEDENNSLQRDVRRAREDLRRADESRRGSFNRGRARVEHTGFNTRERPYETQARPTTHAPPPSRRPSSIKPPSSARLIDRIGSQTHHETTTGHDAKEDETPRSEAQQPQPEQTPDTPTSPPTRPPSVQSDASSNVRKKGTGKKLPRMYENTSDEESDEYKTDTSIGISDGDREVPGKRIKNIGEPAPYRMARNAINHMSISGHICVEKPTSWERKASELYAKWNRMPNKWVWLNGFPMHMAMEASKVPFDQRSHAQRWTVLDATRAGFLPLNDA